MATVLHHSRCRQGALGPLPVVLCGRKNFSARGITQRQQWLLRKSCSPRASKQEPQKDGDGKTPSYKESHRTEAELWGMQKDMMYSQISCINQEREAWLASQTALLTEVRELQRLHRDTVVGAYEAFLVKERSYWERQREDWERKEAALLEQLAAVKASLQQPGSSTTASPHTSGAGLPASTQVADLLRQVAPASTAGQAPTPPTAPHVPVPKAPAAAAAAATTPVTSATMPGFAADLAAAIAAVDHVDVLQDVQLSQFMTRHTAASPATPPHTTPAPAPTATPPPTPEAREKKGPFAGGPWGGGGAVLEPGGQARRVVEATPIETVRAPQNGPPPMLRWGDNDIYWVGRLHSALASHGFYTSDEEEGDFVFGDSTQEAVAYFQASVSLPETGVATVETWEKLLQGTPEEFPHTGGDATPQGGEEGAPRGQGGDWTGAPSSSWHEDENEAAWSRAGAQAASDAGAAASSEGRPEEAPAGQDAPGANGVVGGSSNGSGSGSGGNGKVGEAGPVASSSAGASTSGTSTSGTSTSTGVGISGTSTGVGISGTSTGGSSRAGGDKAERKTWPVVRDGDGGWEVHALQALLTRKGYRCCDDERQWWQCGSSTIEALLYFQACAGLPESGVCAEQTWRQLLASEDDPEGERAVPAALDAVRDGEFDDDMDAGAAAAGRVYLLGEDRWSR